LPADHIEWLLAVVRAWGHNADRRGRDARGPRRCRALLVALARVAPRPRLRPRPARPARLRRARRGRCGLGGRRAHALLLAPGWPTFSPRTSPVSTVARRDC